MGLIIVWAAVLGVGLAGMLWLCCRLKFKPTTASEPQCRRCGYLVVGNVSGVCPECGNDLRAGGVRLPKQRKPLGFFARVIGWAIAVAAAWYLMPAAVVRELDRRLPIDCDDEYAFEFVDHANSGAKTLAVIVQFDHRGAGRPPRMIGLFRPDQSTRPFVGSGAELGTGVLIDPVRRTHRICSSGDVHRLSKVPPPAATDAKWDQAHLESWMTKQGFTKFEGLGEFVDAFTNTVGASRSAFLAELANVKAPSARATGVYCQGLSSSTRFGHPWRAQGVVNVTSIGVWLLGAAVIAVACVRCNRKVDDARWGTTVARWRAAEALERGRIAHEDAGRA
jgi:hypothetical protein